MVIARFPSIVIDCLDPSALATFYGAMFDSLAVGPGQRVELDICTAASTYLPSRNRVVRPFFPDPVKVPPVGNTL
jgi:hypothetical protein